MDEDANFCFQVDFPLLFSWKRFLTLTQILNGLGCWDFCITMWFQTRWSCTNSGWQSLLQGVIMRNKLKSLVHLYFYRCIDDKEQGNNDEDWRKRGQHKQFLYFWWKCKLLLSRIAASFCISLTHYLQYIYSLNKSNYILHCRFVIKYVIFRIQTFKCLLIVQTAFQECQHKIPWFACIWFFMECIFIQYYVSFSLLLYKYSYC